jgi:hypothetical protein
MPAANPREAHMAEPDKGGREKSEFFGERELIAIP